MQTSPADHRSVAASALDLADRRYFLAPEDESPPPRLVNSIREYGILHPPLVQQRDADRFTVVAGRKRVITAITILRWDSVPCIVVPSDCPTLHLYSYLLEQSLVGSPLSLVEQSTFFARLGETSSVEDILPLLAQLGHRPNKHQLDELLSLRQLTPAAQLALHRDILSYTVARKLLRLSPADQDTLVAMITRFQLGGSKQQKLIDLSLELQRRRNQRVQEIIVPLLNDLETAEQQNIPQQGSTLLAWLHQQCFPRSVNAEIEFRRQVEQLHLPPIMQIAHSPSFEDDSLSLVIRFADWDALRKRLTEIRALLDEQ